ncbi:MAG: putative toxin-antitoxin system toxin component, PIN family [Gammaproteobacteria bacterium]|nr:putative toxin-antitoxin system toxin component, PIN family [Gammaproteobacteria bacterium]
MNMVLDTNVFVSGIFWSGAPSNILTLWQQQKIILCVNLDILEEYTRVGRLLAKKYPGVDIEPFLELVAVYGKIFPDLTLPLPVSRDPDDDKFIACAVSANAKVIVSGDKDLLDVGSYSDIDILSPRQFLNKLN